MPLTGTQPVSIQFKLINCKKIAPRMHQNSLLSSKSKKDLFPGEEGTAPPHTQPLGAFSTLILAPTALDSTRACGNRPGCLRRVGPRCQYCVKTDEVRMAKTTSRDKTREFTFLMPNISVKYERGCPNGGTKCRWGMVKISHFQQITCCNSNMVQDKRMVSTKV